MATRKKSRRPARRIVKKAVAKRSVRRPASMKAAARSRANGKASNGKAPARLKSLQPSALKLRSVTPTFTVKDLQETIAWYCDGLGFIVSERWEDGGQLRGVMLKAGNCVFGFSQDDFSKGRDREKGIGFRVYAETAQSVDTMADRMRSYGGKIVAEPADMPWGARSFTVEDPDGFKISFSQPR